MIVPAPPPSAQPGVELQDAVREHADIAAARSSLLEFIMQTKQGMPFEAAPHHTLICRVLEEVEAGIHKRVLLMCPPRHGKSVIASVHFPAWYLGRHPESLIIGSSYGDGLANTMSLDCQAVFRSEKWPFPDVSISKRSRAVKNWQTNHGGRYVSVGMGAGTTGFGGNIILIDDPIKGTPETLTIPHLEKVWNWYTNIIYSRLMPGGAIVVIQTRWNENDLAGRLLKEMRRTGDPWLVIRLPALAEEDDPIGRKPGEPLWPSWYGKNQLAAIQALNPIGWLGLYQQTPPEEMGGPFFRNFHAVKYGKEQITTGPLPWHVWPTSFARERYDIAEDEPFPPKDWLRWASIDEGTRAPWCCLWFTRAPDQRVFIYRERYSAGLMPDRQAQIIRNDTQRAEEKLARVVADPSMFNSRANVGVSDAEVYFANGVPLAKGYNKREPGWRRVLEVMQPMDDGYPRMVILEGAAPNLIRTLPVMQSDPLNIEDVAPGQEDHAVDCLRYGIVPVQALVRSVGYRPIEYADSFDEDWKPDPSALRQTGYVSKRYA